MPVNTLRNFLLVILFFAQVFFVSAQCSFSGLAPSYCIYSPTAQLTSTATGGAFSGVGVIGSVFSPSVAGPGTHTISYGTCPSTYTITSATYSPFAGSNSTSTSSISGEGSTVSLGDDQVTATALSIGFNFQFFCNTYSNFYISSNGFITFSSSQGNGCCAGGSLPNSSYPLNMITLTWTDWNPSVGGTISYTTIGTAPNRKLIVTFNNVPHFASGGGNLTAQLQLFETTNVIEIHTASMIPNTINHTMGVQNSTGSSAYVVTGRNATNTWTATNECYRFTPLPGCISTQTTYVSPDTVAITGNSFICAGSSTSLSASGNVTYTWSTNSNSSSITVTPASNTVYSVSATNAYGCIASSTVAVMVNTVTPTVTAVASNTTNGICPGTTLSLNASGASSYTWSNGITNGVAFSPSVSSTYTVIGANGCGTSTAAVSVSIHPLPLVTASASSPSLCSGNPLTLTGGGANTYTWSGGVLNGIAFTPTSSATYSVTGTSVLGCTASAITSVSVAQSPSVAPISSTSLICLGNSSTLTASGAAAYSWTPANTTNSSIVVSPTVTTTYTLVQSIQSCTNTRTITIFVNQPPVVIAIVAPTVICANNTATLAGGGAMTYTWTAPGFTTTGASPIVGTSVTTIYHMIASDGTCVSTSSVQLAVNPIPTLNIAASSSLVCLGDTATLTVSGALNYTWSPNVSSNTLALVSPTTATLYSATGINSYGCINTVSQIVLVNQLPTVSAVANKTLVCSGGASTLSASGTANVYHWSTGPTTSTISVNPAGTTIYTVTGSSSASGCKNTATVAVSVFSPTFAISGSTAVCPGGSAVITASGASSYTWNTGAFTNNISVMPTVPTVYSVSATSHSNNINCVGTSTILVSIDPNPTVTASTNKIILCKGEKATLTAQGALNYSWSNATTGNNIQVSPSSTTVYTVTGTDANGCVGSGTVQVKVSGCSGIAEISMNTFSGILVYPNPNNGSFMIQSQLDLELILVNELGQTIRSVVLSSLNGHKAELSNVANGIYFLTGTKNEQVVHQKIVVGN